jgi:hypothetical protein
VSAARSGCSRDLVFVVQRRDDAIPESPHVSLERVSRDRDSRCIMTALPVGSRRSYRSGRSLWNREGGRPNGCGGCDGQPGESYSHCAAPPREAHRVSRRSRRQRYPVFGIKSDRVRRRMQEGSRMDWPRRGRDGAIGELEAATSSATGRRNQPSGFLTAAASGRRTASMVFR